MTWNMMDTRRSLDKLLLYYRRLRDLNFSLREPLPEIYVPQAVRTGRVADFSGSNAFMRLCICGHDAPEP